MKMKLSIVVLFFILIISQCKKYELPEYPSGRYRGDTIPSGIYIISRGNKNISQDGSISLYEPYYNKLIYQDIISQINGSKIDEPASMAILDTLGFIPLSTSGKIQVISIRNGKMYGDISLGGRYAFNILIYSRESGLVTDPHNMLISVFNPLSRQKTSEIILGKEPGEMSLINDRIYVGTDPGELFVIDLRTQSILTSLVLLPGAMYSTIANGILWVLCDGISYSTGNKTKPGIRGINPSSTQIIYNLDIDTIPGYHYLNPPFKIVASADETALFFIYKHILRVRITANPITIDTVIYSNGRNFSALFVHKPTGDIYVADGKDGVLKGVVYRYSSQFTPIDSFEVGVNPVSFAYSK